jgi:GNAT superfamily N-acetyltransferase
MPFTRWSHIVRDQATPVRDGGDMTDNARSRHLAPRWRRDLVELAALFTAVATADVVANLVVQGPEGPELLVVSAAALVAAAVFHTWWARRHGHAPPAEPSEPGGETSLWRMRTTVRDVPGSLAALCVSLAALDADILTFSTHPLPEGTVDEFLLRAPTGIAPRRLADAVAEAGGRDTWIERADAHDLVDTPTKVLTLATRAALDSAELPSALRQLFGPCSTRSLSVEQGAEHEDTLDGTTMCLRDPSGGSLIVSRPHLPFTPAEFARARALLELDARLGARMPDIHDTVTQPAGHDLAIRRLGAEDLEAAIALHGRCSTRTLKSRYRGPVEDADRYLEHLLSPRFGQTLAVEAPDGQIVAVAHLLWDGEETEVALLVEDAWQRRGLGGELLRRLVALARDAGYTCVYAVTESSNTAMVATMRGLALPLDHQVEEDTLVITARLSGAAHLSAS